MNIQLYKLYEYILYIIVFLNLEYLNIFNNLNGIVANITVILTVILFIIYIFTFGKDNKNMKYYFIFCGILFLFFVFQIFRNVDTTFSINYAIKNRIGLIKYYTYILLLFPICKVLSEKKQSFIRNIYILGMIALMLRILVWFLYNKVGLNLMPGLFSVMGYSWSHGSGIRLPGTFLDGFLLSYSLSKIRDNRLKHRRIYPYLICAGISLYYVYYVFNSRSQILCCLLVIMLSFAFVNNRIFSSLAKVLLLVLCCFFIAKIYLHTDFLQSVLNFYDPGTQVRFLGFDFYQSDWLNHKILGFGIVSDGNIFHTWYNSWIYYLSDLGIVNTLFQFGYVGLIILFSPFIFSFFIGLKNNRSLNGYFLMLLSFYTILSSIFFQNVYDSPRILIVPFILALMQLSMKDDKNNEERCFYNRF